MTNTHRFRARLILALGLLVSPVMLGAEIIEQILVKVNGEIFTKTDLETRQVQAMRQRGIQLDPKSDPTDAQLRQALNTVTPQVMVEAVTEMLLVQRAKELGYKLGDDQFKQIVDNIRKENKLDTDEKFQAALKQENMTVADLRRQVERSILVQRVESVEVFGKVAITEDEARRYYDAHLAEFTTPAAVTLREILVAVPADKAADAAQDAAAKTKAEELRARAVAGENYMKLAEDSSDAPSKANAGLIGPISLSDLSPELRKVIEPMKNGEVSPVIPHAARLPDLQSRDAERVADDAVRAGTGADRRPHRDRQAQGGVRQIPDEAAGAGDHRVEESGHQESVRRGARKAEQRSRH